MDKIIHGLAEKVEHIEQKAQIIQLRQKFDMFYQLKSLNTFNKLTPKLILNHIQISNEHIISKEVVEQPESRNELFFLFKWMFQEVLITLTQLRNMDLSKYLNAQILSKNRQLFDFLKIKHKTSDIEKLIVLLQDEEEVDFDQLIEW